MMSNVQRLQLDQRANDYIASQVDDSTTFSSLLQSVIQPGTGQAWTFLPEGVTEARAYEFLQPEFIPVNTHRRFTRTTPMIEVATLRSEFCAHIVNSLKQLGPNACCLLADSVLLPGDDLGRLSDLVFTLDESVVLFLDNQSSVEQVSIAVDAFAAPWRGIGVVCDPDYPISRTTMCDIDELKRCLMHVTEIFSVAYDGEGFIIVDQPDVIALKTAS